MSWTEMNLGDLYKVGSSKRVLKSDWKSQGVPFYRGREISSLSKYGQVENDLFISETMYEEFFNNFGVPLANDIMITAIGTIGNTYIVKKDDKFYYKDASVLWLKKVKEVDSVFINYWFKSNHFTNQLGVGIGATVDTLTIGKVQSLKIKVPSLATQQKIVAKLDAIFAEIERANVAIEANVKNAEALFQSYLREVFEREGKNWRMTKISELGRVQSGGTPSISKKEYWGEEVEWFSSGELNNLYTLSSIRRITLNGIKNSNAKIFPVNSLLIGMYDTAAMKMSVLSKPASFNQAIVGIEPNENINTIYLYYALTYVKPYVLSLRRGVRQKNLSLAKIKDLMIKLPKIEIQNEIAKRLNFFNNTSVKLKNRYLEKIEQQLNLKQSILQRAFNGELIK